MIDTTNVLTSGQTSHGASKDPLEACLPYSSGILRDAQVLGALAGLADALTDGQLNHTTAWKPDQQFTGAAAATPVQLVPPTSADPLLLRITSPTDASDVLGNTQAQSTGGTVGAAAARWFPRTGQAISFLNRVKWSNNAGATLVGLCNVATGLLSAAGAVSANLTDGVYFYRAPGSGTVTAFVRRAGANTASVVLTTTAAAGTYYELGFRFDTNGVVFSFTDGATGQRTETSAAMTAAGSPNAALAFTAIQGGNARTLDLQRSFAAQEAI